MRLSLTALQESKARCFEQFAASPTGLDWSDAWTEVIDGAIREVYYQLEHESADVGPISVVATGGYGRRDLSPFSDVDLAVIPLDEQAPGLDQVIRNLFNQLHIVLNDALGVRVDYSYRLIADAPSLDPKTRTSLLESRLIAGSDRPYDRLLSEFWRFFPVGDFLIQKKEERAAYHARTHDTPLVVVPDLKEGAGGLRDFQASNWVRQALGERPQAPPEDYDFLLMVRNALHFAKGKHVDQLTHVAQPEVAKTLGLDPKIMMDQLHRAMTALNGHWLEALDRIPDSRFELAEGVFALRGEVRISAGAHVSDAALGVANATKLGLRVPPFTALVSPQVTANQALRALNQGDRVIRNMDACGVLPQLLPELCLTKRLLPDDQSHRYTVFEHTLRAARLIESLRGQEGFLSGVYQRIQDKGAFILGTLLHDVGKADHSDSHSITGERMAHEICRRWKLDQDRADTVAWLVRNHLLMSHTIRMRDVQHPDTIHEFGLQVETLERLAMLTVLTWADSSAVAPDIWSQTQDAFLRELFERTETYLVQQSSVVADPEAYRSLVRRQLKGLPHDEAKVQEFTASLPAHYLLSTEPTTIPFHFELAQKAKQGEFVVAFETAPDISASRLTISAPDSPGLLSRVLGLIYALDLGLIGLRACTTSGENPVAVDVFTITFGGEPVPPSTCTALKKLLEQRAQSDNAVLEILIAKGKVIEMDAGELRTTFHPGNPAILEIRGRRGRGLAYRFSRVIAQQGWNILGARVGQWAGQSTASFTINGPDGSALQPEQVSRAFTALV